MSLARHPSPQLPRRPVQMGRMIVCPLPSSDSSRCFSQKGSLCTLEEKVINLEHRIKNLHSHHSLKDHPQTAKESDKKPRNEPHSPRLLAGCVPPSDQLERSCSSKDFQCSPRHIDFNSEHLHHVPETHLFDTVQVQVQEQQHLKQQQEPVFVARIAATYHERAAQIMVARCPDSSVPTLDTHQPHWQLIKLKTERFSEVKDEGQDPMILRYLSYLLYIQLAKLSGNTELNSRIESQHAEIVNLRAQLKESESTTNSSHGIRKIVDETVHVLGEALDSMRRMSGSTNAGSKEKISMLQVQNLSDRVLKLQGNLEGSAHKSERSPQLFSQLVTECHQKPGGYNSAKLLLETQRNQQQYQQQQTKLTERSYQSGAFKNISNQQVVSGVYGNDNQSGRKQNKSRMEDEKAQVVEVLKMENDKLKSLLESQQKELLRVNEKTTQINETFEKLMKHNNLLQEEAGTEMVRKDILSLQLLLEKERQQNTECQDEICRLQEQLKSTKVSNMLDLQNSECVSNPHQDRILYDLQPKKNSTSDPTSLMGEINKLNIKIKDQQSLFNYLFSEAQQLGQMGLIVLEMCLATGKDSLAKTLSVLSNEFMLKRQQIQMKLTSLETYEQNCRLQFKENADQRKASSFYSVLVQHQKSYGSKSFTEQLDKSHIRKIGGGITQRDDSCQYFFSQMEQQQQLPQLEGHDYLCMLFAQCTVIEKIIAE